MVGVVPELSAELLRRSAHPLRVAEAVRVAVIQQSVPELGSLTNLGMLSLGVNQLTGPIPPELGNLSGLLNLWLSDNRLTGCVPATLKADNNDIEGLGLEVCTDS